MNGRVAYIPSGAGFAAADITFWCTDAHRDLSEAVAAADVVVSCPRGTPEVPAELEPWVREDLTPRMQFMSAHVSSRAVARRWAEIDPAVIYVENPHPPLVTRPIPGRILRAPHDEDDARRLGEAVSQVARRGAVVYERTRLDVLDAMVRVRARGAARLTALSLHDRVTPGLPAVVSLANRGDAVGAPRPEDPTVTMPADRLRSLADSYRSAFAVQGHDEIVLNRPKIGGVDLLEVHRRFGPSSPIPVDAVANDFLRGYLLGERVAAAMSEPGDEWPELDHEWIDTVAQRLRQAWRHHRSIAR